MPVNNQIRLHDALLHALRNGGTDDVVRAVAAGGNCEQALDQGHSLASKLPALVASDVRSKVRLGVNLSLLGAVLISDVDKSNFDVAAFKSLPSILLNNAGRQWHHVPAGGVWTDSGNACSMAYLFQHVEDIFRAGRIYAEKIRFAAADFVVHLAPHLSDEGVRAFGIDLVGAASKAAARKTLFMATNSTLALFDEFASHWAFPVDVQEHLAALRIESTAHQFLFKDFSADPESVTLMHIAASNPTAQSKFPVKFIERLIQAGCDIDARSSRHAMTPLMCAARAGRPSMMKVLLDAGADHRAQDAQGKSVRDHVELLKDGESKRLALSLLQSISARQAVDDVLKRAKAHSRRPSADT